MQSRQTSAEEAGQLMINSQDEARCRLMAERRNVILAIAVNPLGGAADWAQDDQKSDYASIDQIRNVEYGHREALSLRLHMLDEALERIALGVYGLCAECGARIVERRLNIDPAVAFCVGCQTAFERAG